MDLSTFTDPQARATIEAARIGADAAIHAAWIQATAAAGALAAGVLAYIGAVRQVRLQERAQEVRALAYRFRLLRVVEEYHEQVARACAVAEEQLAAFRSGRASAAITSFQLVKPRMLHDENWEAHALLGRRAVELILTIDDLSLRLAQFDQEIRAQGTQPIQVSPTPRFAKATRGKPGSRRTCRSMPSSTMRRCSTGSARRWRNLWRSWRNLSGPYSGISCGSRSSAAPGERNQAAGARTSPGARRSRSRCPYELALSAAQVRRAD